MIWLWIGFVSFVLIMLALDLGVFNRKAHVVSAKEAMRWVAVFVALGLGFSAAVYYIYEHNWLGIADDFNKTLQKAAESPAPHMPVHTAAEAGAAIEKQAAVRGAGATAAMQYIAGWLTEYALSIDNIFVIAMVFTFFKVPPQFQHRVLFWGILGALVMRGVMIGVGVQLIQHFEWLLYVFGLVLIYTAIKMLRGEDEKFDPSTSRTVRLVRRLVPLAPDFDGQKFFVRLPTAGGEGGGGGAAAAGRLAITPLFLVLIVVEVTDVVFAVDSIPAIIGITRDPFLVFTSNVFAIMGLRSLYFALASLMDKFHYLKYSLAAVLAFVGVKMLLEGVHLLHKLEGVLPESLHGLVSWAPKGHVHIPTPVSLGFIVLALGIGVVASLVFARKHPEHKPGAGGPPPAGGAGHSQ